MHKDSILDLLGSIALKLLGPVLRSLPLGLSFSFGSFLGLVFYYFDLPHRALTYAHIKKALGGELSPCQLRALTKRFYRGLGQNFIELFLIPLMNRRYMDKYVEIEGKQHPQEALARGKGVIMVAVHSGSWELSNLVCALLGLNFSLLVREQHFPRLNKLLTIYRRQSGFKLIQRQGQVRELIRALKDNQAVGMTTDQGGKGGVLVEFFGREASMAAGPVALALKYDAAIIPAFYTRVRGPYIKTILMPPFRIQRGDGEGKDIRDNVQRLTRLYEDLIRTYPFDYLWSYKIWKYGLRKKVLIISDGKAGHVRQSQAVAQILKKVALDRAITLEVDTHEVKFKRGLCRAIFKAETILSGKYSCQGCLWCVKRACTDESYVALRKKSPDIVISAGATVAAVNCLVACDNQAKSIAVMRPGLISTKRFDLVIMPAHDRPPRRKNVVATVGALNLISQPYLLEQVRLLMAAGRGPRSGRNGYRAYIGVLIGGDAKNFVLKKETVDILIRQLKSAAEKLECGILVTTSRRTSREIEALIKDELGAYARCALLVIANESNIPEAVGAIVGLSSVVVVSPESISMISEAASSNRYTIVFEGAVDRRHRRFLDNLAQGRYIYRSQPQETASVIERLLRKTPPIKVLDDKQKLEEALKKIL